MFWVEREEIRELCLCEVRRLGAGSHVNSTVLTDPADRAMSFEMGVLDFARVECPFVDRICHAEARIDIADLAFDFLQDVAVGFGNARFGAFVIRIGAEGCIASSGSKTAGRTS